MSCVPVKRMLRTRTSLRHPDLLHRHASLRIGLDAVPVDALEHSRWAPVHRPPERTAVTRPGGGNSVLDWLSFRLSYEYRGHVDTPTPPYFHSPLAIVVAEIRHIEGAELSDDAIGKLKTSLAEVAPIARIEEAQRFVASFGVSGFADGTRQETVKLRKFSSRDRQLTVTFGPEAITVETTAYQSWTWFRAIVKRALEARQELSPLDGLLRVGLRMVDEIRVEDTLEGWKRWIDASLLGPSDVVERLGYVTQKQQGVLQTSTGNPGRALIFRYGPGEGRAVVDSPTLIRPIADYTGEFFLLDFDSFEEPADQSIPEVRPADIMNTMDALHSESKGLFEAVITQALRDEVLNAN